ncbi:MAG: ParA family protein [Anaerolineales bacterium]|nr:ParA family protein [Anaerolineales bacterium]
MRIIAIANHKGGVGKTATAHTLGVALSKHFEHRVLLVDIDPQASLSGSCGIMDTAEKSIAEVLGGAVPGTLSIHDAIRKLDTNLSLLPADIALAVTELGLVSRMNRDSVLKKQLAEVSSLFDVILIDCPPSLGMLTINALTAADGVLLPTQPQSVDLRGMQLFLDTLDQVRSELNPAIETIGVLPTFYDGRLIHHQDALHAMQGAGLPVFPVQIGRTVRIAEAAHEGESVLTFAPENPQAQAYLKLAEEVSRWLENGQV